MHLNTFSSLWSPVTKSTVMCNHKLRGFDSELRRPTEGWCDDFPRAHTGQAVMKDLASQTMEGHDNHCCRKCRVRLRPRWYASRDKCPHCRTLEWAESRLNQGIWQHTSSIRRGAQCRVHHFLDLPGGRLKLTGVEASLATKIRLVLVVYPDHKQLCRVLQPLLLQSQH